MNNTHDHDVLNFRTDGKKKDDDSSFIYNLGILIGCVAEIETKKGEKFEGVLSAFTNQALKIMIEAAHEPTGDDESSITKHYDLLIVPADKVNSDYLIFKLVTFQSEGRILGCVLKNRFYKLN